ncbi:anhydro-N-acetylmuramic acid kinase [Capsulimonas corticalis]|uniref:Anhydro-N-acetylmuramic acid kinase n=1 Tax=Capsulimonas corticalis TaxID=2219043 RepID=A0A402CYD5_9BACT|nr:anhydro-N-acetylmuramic acid kinase [Capsulimonas corticalis]BDI31405.1 anhydro-N-acetylmuramic acid kinase [Capsulimonas corticalis]
MALFCGVMSGTSMDGVDVAFAEINILSADAQRPSFEVHLTADYAVPYSADLRDRLLRLRGGAPTSIAEVCALHHTLGAVYADAIEHAAQDAAIDLATIAAVGLHGQTVWHSPPSTTPATPGTLQIGQPATIAERLGVTVVSDFRARDIAAGGEGAPLIPFADYVLLGSPTETRVILNIGGIANLTYLPAGGSLADIIAFDTGPGNTLIDGAAQRLLGASRDNGGQAALSGRVQERAVAEALAHPYFQAPPPKSTGPELFNEVFLGKVLQACADCRPEDKLATLAAITTRSIAAAILALPAPPARMIVGGGGTQNAALMQGLATALPGTEVQTHEALGISSASKEALAFAVLAAARVNGIAASAPTATGARAARLLGCLTAG